MWVWAIGLWAISDRRFRAIEKGFPKSPTTNPQPPPPTPNHQAPQHQPRSPTPNPDPPTTKHQPPTNSSQSRGQTTLPEEGVVENLHSWSAIRRYWPFGGTLLLTTQRRKISYHKFGRVDQRDSDVLPESHAYPCMEVPIPCMSRVQSWV